MNYGQMMTVATQIHNGFKGETAEYTERFVRTWVATDETIFNAAVDHLLDCGLLQTTVVEVELYDGEKHFAAALRAA